MAVDKVVHVSYCLLLLRTPPRDELGKAQVESLTMRGEPLERPRLEPRLVCTMGTGKVKKGYGRRGEAKAGVRELW